MDVIFTLLMSRALSVLLDALSLDLGLFSVVDIKHEGLWSTNACWNYVTSSCAATYPFAVGLATTVHATAPSSL